jgi:RNA polymerase sigma factor (sigma-70 family)
MPDDAANSPVLAAYRAYVQLLARLRLPPGLHACFDLNDLAEQVLCDTCGDSADVSHLPCLLRRRLAARLLAGVRNLDAELNGESSPAHATLLRQTAHNLEEWHAQEQTLPRRDDPQHERAARLARALASLPPLQREAVILRLGERRPLAEISRIVGASAAEVARALAEGLELVRPHLEE